MTEQPPPVDFPSLTTLTKPLLVDYLYIALRLPEDQRAQWSALSDGRAYDAEQMAISLAARTGPKWCLVEADGTPIALGGYDYLRAGVWQDFLIGTPEGWALHWRAITKHCKRVMDHMLATDAHRLQAIALASRTKAIAWFRAVGLEYEATLRCYGHDGEDCVMYSRIARPAPPLES